MLTIDVFEQFSDVICANSAVIFLLFFLGMAVRTDHVDRHCLPSFFCSHCPASVD